MSREGADDARDVVVRLKDRFGYCIFVQVYIGERFVLLAAKLFKDVCLAYLSGSIKYKCLWSLRDFHSSSFAYISLFIQQKFGRISSQNQQKSGLFLLERFFHLLDGVFLGGFGDVDVGLHGLIVAVAGESGIQKRPGSRAK